MPAPATPQGIPGVHTTNTTGDVNPICKSAPEYLPGGAIIDASLSLDGANTGNTGTLRRGTLIKRLSTGLWVPAILGLITSDYTSGGTTLTIGVPAALNLSKQLGASGTGEFWVMGYGTGATVDDVDAVAVTHSAVSTTAGTVTVTDLGASFDAGSMLLSFAPVLLGGTGGALEVASGLALIDDEYGVRVTDSEGNDVDAQCARPLVGGLIDFSRIPYVSSLALVNRVLAWNLERASRLRTDLDFGG